MLSGLATLGGLLLEVLRWLKTGVWGGFTLAYLGVQVPPTGWIGADRLVSWYLDLSVSTAAFIAAAFFYAIVWAITPSDQR